MNQLCAYNGCKKECSLDFNVGLPKKDAEKCPTCGTLLESSYERYYFCSMKHLIEFSKELDINEHS